MASPVLGQNEDQDAATDPDAQASEQTAEDAEVATPPVTRNAADNQSDDGREDEQAQAVPSDNSDEDADAIEALIPDWIRPYFSKSDTAAQWAMALIGMVATVISAFAVILVWKTLNATRAMVTETRNIGIAQSQAYPIVEKVGYRFHAGDGGPKAWATIKNTGQTPAYNLICNLFLRPSGYGEALYHQGTIIRALGSGEAADAVWSPHFRIFDDEVIARIRQPDQTFNLVIVIIWETVFKTEDTQSHSFHYIAKVRNVESFNIDFDVTPIASVDGIYIGNEEEDHE